jgi:hypothetical protein
MAELGRKVEEQSTGLVPKSMALQAVALGLGPIVGTAPANPLGLSRIVESTRSDKRP